MRSFPPPAAASRRNGHTPRPGRTGGWRRRRSARRCGTSTPAPLDGFIEVGIVKDDKRRVAAQPGETFDVFRALLHQLAANLGRAGKGELAHQRVAGQFAADRAGGAGDHVEYSGGDPARFASSASASAENGVWLAGFRTMVQPAASAGPALRVIIAAGKFHGVMAAVTPMGCLITSRRLSARWPGMVSP